MAETHGHAGWYRVLVEKANRDELTLTESMALALHNIQNHLWSIKDDAHEARLAAEHTEGMLGALDTFVEQLAVRSAIPYPTSATVRAALDQRRDEQRHERG